MIVRKIGNPVDKESKTQPRNQETRKTVVSEEGSTGEHSEHPLTTWSTDPLESLMEDYLDQTDWFHQQRKSPVRKSNCAFNSQILGVELTKVETETVREYKKYMQTPVAFRETLVKWRKRHIQEHFKNSTNHTNAHSQKLHIEHDFLSTLAFYGTLKEKVLSPLLNMQVSGLTAGTNPKCGNGQSLF